MSKVFPLKALYYNSQKADLSSLITPPYDNISASQKTMLEKKSPYNFVHVSLPTKTPEGYQAMAKTLEDWKVQEVLSRHPEPSFFLYGQTFELGGKQYHRRSLLAGVGLYPFEDQVVKPHEQTHEGPKEDRLQILRHTDLNLSAVFSMVKDKNHELEKIYNEVQSENPAMLQATGIDGVLNEIWPIPAHFEATISAFFEDKPLYIVDGHHRYSSALYYAREKKVEGQFDHPSSSVFMAIANAYDPGLLVLPTHRLLGAFPTRDIQSDEFFEVEKTSKDELGTFTSTPREDGAFLLYQKSTDTLFKLTPLKSQLQAMDKALSTLSVFWSDQVFLKQSCQLESSEREKAIEYEAYADAAWQMREQKEAIIFLPPISVDAIAAVADAQGYMPQKSTFFYPKLAAGIVLRDMRVTH